MPQSKVTQETGFVPNATNTPSSHPQEDCDWVGVGWTKVKAVVRREPGVGELSSRQVKGFVFLHPQANQL